ncbi:MAG: putative Se/S carrier-like protein [Clostridia bacterium]
MKNTIVLSSVTYAIKAQKLLEPYGIGSSLTRSSGVRAIKGCGYGLKINGDVQDAARIIKKDGIRILGYSED